MYTLCAHHVLSDREHCAYKWLDIYSPAYNALKSVVLDTRLLNDIPQLTQFIHTGNLEVFHSLLGKYCPNTSIFHMKECMPEPNLQSWIIILGSIGNRLKQMGHHK